MGAEQTDLSGPDLRQGVPLARLDDGEMMVGHVHGEAVLLARRGDEVFAIGATCTHYGGPLAEGLMVEDTVRCPWHHACFSLRTGEALRAPALAPVSAWGVERRGDVLYVTEKTDQAHRHSSADENGPTDIVVVGAGAAGDAAAEMLRREGFNGRITMIGADEAAPYDRPNLSKDYLAGSAPEEWLPLRPSGFYKDLDINLVLGTHVIAINPETGRVALSNGHSHRFDRLLLATGAVPVQLPIHGADLPHVYYLRTLADCRAILARDEPRHAVVIGAGFIGMEVAGSLRARGIEVHVVSPGLHPLGHVLGTKLGDMVRDLHKEHGVVFHLGQTVMSISPKSVTLSTGKEIKADVVVVGIGVRPSTFLAERAGLETEDGVLVDAYLETSHAGIFAVGDLARWPDHRSGEHVRIEHWVVAQRQGQVAACNMLGHRQPFDAIPFFWTQHYDVPIAYVGHAPEWDRIDVAGSIEERDCLIAFRLEGKTLAVAGIHRDRDLLEAEAAMERADEQALRDLIPS